MSRNSAIVLVSNSAIFTLYEGEMVFEETPYLLSALSLGSLVGKKYNTTVLYLGRVLDMT
jgi:hypothetical protein